MPGKCADTIKALCVFSSSRVRANGKQSPPFNTSSSVRQGCSLSPILLNYAIDEVTETAFTGHDLQGVDLILGDRFLGLECADETVPI